MGAVIDATGWDPEALAAEISRRLDSAQSVWIDNPPPPEALGSEALNPAFQRDLYRMERDLPMDESADIATRPFVAGQDEPAWLELNNLAFADHREQGGWTPARLAQRMAEPWFDPEGFRLHETDGRLAGFCWTKAHPAAVGEVYAIAVHPDRRGQGLGRALTLAGYEHLAAAGFTRAMLYVDADNAPALALYRDLGLEIVATRRLYAR